MNFDPSSLARISVYGDDPEGFRGTGFVISPDHVLTCAHVLTPLIDLNWDMEEAVQALDIRLSFGDDLDPVAQRKGTVMKCDSPDLALVRLDRPVECRPMRLVSGLKSSHEAELSRIHGLVIGFSQGTKLIKREIEDPISLTSDFHTQHLLNLQVGGGLPVGMSGSPFMADLGNEFVCLGMVHLGGDGRALSQFILSDNLVDFLTRNNVPLLTIEAAECFQSQRASEALQHFQRLSSITASDAEIIDLSFGESGEPLKLAQGLYVRRQVESDVMKHLADEPQGTGASKVLIVGEAGYGKTSMLWHLYETLPRTEWEPWFLKSALLSRRSPAIHGSGQTPSGFDHALLSQAIAATVAGGRKPVLLLDTLDLLLHEEQDRLFLLELLQSISDEGGRIVATCRHQEARYLRPVGMKRVELKQFNDHELLDAVEKHVARFYRHALPEDAKQHLQNIQEAVARGMPLREVCASPLMLRMLFLIYRPAKISQEIHAFRLYEEFWDLRVKSDRRAGSPLQSSNNLERACCLVALTMLSEGNLELDHELVMNTTERHKVPISEVEELISRGVLKKTESESATLSFFHQTFFEHSAARGMVRCFNETGISMLETRLGRSWSDLFCAPVLEHAMLLGENIAGPVRTSAGRALSALLAHESMAANTSGVYVYCHRKQVAETDVKQMRALLTAAPNPVVDHFLQVAPNVPQSRFKTLFDEIEEIWKRDRWAEQEFALALLERLAFRESESVRHFLETHQVLQFVVRSKAANVAERKLARVLMVLARTSVLAPWVLEQFILLFNGIFHRTAGTDAPAKVLIAVAECAGFLGAKYLGTRFDAQMLAWRDEHVRDFNQLVHAYGHLWFLEWQAREELVERIVADIHQTSDFLRFTAKLEGLAEFVLVAREADVEVLLSAVLHEKIAKRRWAWISGFLKRLMIGNAVVGDEQFVPAVCVAMRERLVSILLKDDRDRDKDLAKRVRRMIYEAFLPPDLFCTMFGPSIANDPQLWISSEHLADLLPEGYMAKHPGAVQALENALAQPVPYRKLLIKTRIRLGFFVKTDERIAEQFLRLTFLLQETSGLMDRLLEIADAHPQLLQSFKSEFETLLRHLMGSPLGKLRRAGVALWQEMLRLNLSGASLLTEVFAIFDKEEDEVARSGLLLVMGLTVSKSGHDIRLLIDKLGSLTVSEDIDVNVNARTALISAVLRSPADAIQYGSDILGLIVQTPTDSSLVGQLGYVLEQVGKNSPAEGVKFCRQILLSKGVTQLGLQSKRTLSFRLRQPVRVLTRDLNRQQREDLLSLVPDLDHILGSIIVDAICHEHFMLSTNLLDDIVADTRVSPEIKEQIRRAKYIRERTVGGQAWPELFVALRGTRGIDSQ